MNNVIQFAANEHPMHDPNGSYPDKPDPVPPSWLTALLWVTGTGMIWGGVRVLIWVGKSL